MSEDTDPANIVERQLVTLYKLDALWRDLGMPETLWHCRVKEFGPLIVSIDTEGRNLFEENKVLFNERKDKAIEEICKHVGFIK